MAGGEVRRSPDGDLECCCAECGAVPVDADDLAALMLDENWLHRRLRAALNIESDGGSTTLAGGRVDAWSCREDAVVLTRDIRSACGESPGCWIACEPPTAWCM
jgi:hypothetical protein